MHTTHTLTRLPCRYMKILLVGESGLGKTTFVRNLFAAYARDASFPVNDASVPNAPRVGLRRRGSSRRACSPTQSRLDLLRSTAAPLPCVLPCMPLPLQRQPC